MNTHATLISLIMIEVVMVAVIMGRADIKQVRAGENAAAGISTGSLPSSPFAFAAADTGALMLWKARNA